MTERNQSHEEKKKKGTKPGIIPTVHPPSLIHVTNLVNQHLNHFKRNETRGIC